MDGKLVVTKKLAFWRIIILGIGENIYLGNMYGRVGGYGLVLVSFLSLFLLLYRGSMGWGVDMVLGTSGFLGLWGRM